MKTKKRTNLRYLLIGLGVALAAYIISGWDDVVRGFNDGLSGGPYHHEKAK